MIDKHEQDPMNINDLSTFKLNGKLIKLLWMFMNEIYLSEQATSVSILICLCDTFSTRSIANTNL